MTLVILQIFGHIFLWRDGGHPRPMFPLGQSLVGGQNYFTEYPEFFEAADNGGGEIFFGGGDNIFLGFAIQNFGSFEEKLRNI